MAKGKTRAIAFGVIGAARSPARYGLRENYRARREFAGYYLKISTIGIGLTKFSGSFLSDRNDIPYSAVQGNWYVLQGKLSQQRDKKFPDKMR